MIRFESGGVRFTVLDGGRLRLDGGAMFGVVPRVLWERARPPDSRHRIVLAMNLLLVEDGKTTTLVDTGAGTKDDSKLREIYALEPKGAAEILAPAGLRPEDVDRVVLSHLHFDHAGGATARDASRTLVPSFPNAEYVAQRGEVAFAREDNERTRASYDPAHFEPLEAGGRLRLVDGDAQIGARLALRLAPGHTPFHQIALFETAERTVAFLADLVPTATHAPYPWIMGYDVEPLRSLETKKRFLPTAVRDGWWCVLEHDADLPLARFEESKGRIAARPAPVEV